MAIQNSFIKIKGELGGLTFYERNGKTLVKTTTSVDKERIMNDPNYRRTRENMQEFGASATLGKAFRLGFAGISKEVRTLSITGRVTGMMKRINRIGSGNRGERSFEILPNKQILEGFDFNRKLPLDNVFYPPYDAPVIDSNRSVVTWTVPDFNTQNYIRIPNGASHAKLVLHATILSDFIFDTSDGAYQFVHPEENTRNTTAMSSEFALAGDVGSDISLTADLGLTSALPVTAGVLISTGILFYQQINGLFYTLANNNALQVVKVG
jgi:hypothetical protein